MTATGPDTPAARSALEKAFPGLTSRPYDVTSPRDPFYNCIAWAAGDDQYWWEPGVQIGGYYWPEGLPAEATIENYVRAFRRQGYRPCGSGELEDGYEKVAIYADADGRPTHAARQVTDGRWASKCGKLEDIVHERPEDVGGSPGYGSVHTYLRRPEGNYPHPQARNISFQ